jgi:plastocyanin
MRLALAALALLALLALAAPAPASSPRKGIAVGVAEREFRISLYRHRVRPGLVRLNIRNLGEDSHNVVVRSRRGRVLATSGDIRSGRTATLAVRLRRPGVYRLLCTKADHTARGMKARLRVRRRSA